MYPTKTQINLPEEACHAIEGGKKSSSMLPNGDTGRLNGKALGKALGKTVSRVKGQHNG